MTTPEVEVIIAVHTPERNLERSVGSVLDHTQASIRVTIVCHNTPLDEIRTRLDHRARDPRTRLVELQDDIASPAGPFNYGLQLAEGRYTSVMGSDDELEDGAIDSWLRVARRSEAAAVIARVRHAGGRAVPSPPTRPFRRRRLDGVRDRLSYRSAPLGLVSRAEFGSLRFADGVRTGEDIPYVTAMWFSGASIVYDRTGPAYLIHSDGPARVTTQAPPIAQDLEYLQPLIDSEEFLKLADQQRHALLVKILRSTYFSLLQNRERAECWTVAERRELAQITRMLRGQLAHTVLGERVLSRADVALLDAAENESSSTEHLLSLASARRRFLTSRALIPQDIRDVLRREAPLRFAVASVLARC